MLYLYFSNITIIEQPYKPLQLLDTYIVGGIVFAIGERIPIVGILSVAIHVYISKFSSYTRSTYAPVLVLMRIRSPVVRKSGTCTISPVSVVAGLVPPVAVSPLKPG